jgi:hypothetical protein
VFRHCFDGAVIRRPYPSQFGKRYHHQTDLNLNLMVRSVARADPASHLPISNLTQPITNSCSCHVPWQRHTLNGCCLTTLGRFAGVIHPTIAGLCPAACTCAFIRPAAKVFLCQSFYILPSFVNNVAHSLLRQYGLTSASQTTSAPAQLAHQTQIPNSAQRSRLYLTS